MQFDERDTMFARMARKPGTEAYRDYYARRPELRQTDDRIRSMPALGEPGGRYYHQEHCAQADRYFEDIDAIRPDERVVTKWRTELGNAPSPTAAVKKMILELGAVAVGCAALSHDFIYTHKGRLDEDYGRSIQLDHPSIIVFLVEMDFHEMQHAPRAETLRESARQYHRGASISKTVTATLQACGYAAKSHHDAHYDVILPPLAVEAGLGELGRNNILIADRYGARVRIGGVTTDIPLDYDAPIDLGVDAFCSTCRKCARNCPSRALSAEAKDEVRGFRKWSTHVESCYSYWRAMGTDCGICMAVCPFSHRNNAFHNLVRWVVRRAPWTHRTARLLDEVCYGRRWRSAKT